MQNLRKNNSEQKSDLSSYEGQFDEESSDETIVFKPKTSSQSSQVKGKDKETQSIWEEEVEQFEKETLNS